MDLSSTQFMKSQVFIEKIEMRFQVIDYYLFLFFPSKKEKKHRKNKTYEQTRKGNVFTQDISRYDLMISRAKDNYQELTTVIADR